MTTAQTPVDKTSPLWLAWLAYIASDEYANSLRWAKDEQHSEGSLWAAFVEGWNRRPSSGSAPEPEVEQRIARIRERLEKATPGPLEDQLVSTSDARFLLDELSRRAVPGEDSARLDWLEKQIPTASSGGYRLKSWRETPDTPRYYLVGDSAILEQDHFSLREAIDAARSTPSEQESK